MYFFSFQYLKISFLKFNHNILKFNKFNKFINILKIILIIFFKINLLNSYAKVIPEIQDFVGNRHFYIGIGTGYNTYNFEDQFIKAISAKHIEVTSHAINTSMPILGLKLQGDYSIGMELGQVFYNKLKFKNVNTGYLLNNNKLKISNTFFSFIGYLPLIKDKFNNLKAELLLGIGAGHLAIREKGGLGTLGMYSDYKKYGLYTKFGLQYNLYNHFNIRVMLGYQQVGHISECYAIKNIKFINLDFIYTI